MKALPILATALALSVLGSACTFQNLAAKAGHGRVIVSAHGPQKASSRGPSQSVGPDKSLGRAALLRTPAETSQRNLSASTDIESITYQVIDLSDNSVYEEGDVDLYYLSIELLLPPGGEFRIVVDVALKDGAPGTNVGVTRYGDQADFVVDDYYDTYVDLTIHPSQALVFDAATVTNGTPSTVKVFDPVTQAYEAAPREFLGAAVTPSPADKFFYGPNADLYYFNKAANAVYRWTNIASKMAPSDQILSGAADFDSLQGFDPADITVELYAACADPTTAGVLWVVGKDTSDGQWHYYYCDVTSGVPAIWEYSSEDEDLENGVTNLTTHMRGYLDAGTAVLVPTGIAVDSTYRDVYITYYASGTDASSGLASVESGLLQYYDDGLDNWFPSETPFVDSTSGIFTDVAWDQGKVWVLSAPNTTIPGASASTGKANIWLFDEYLSPYFLDAKSKTYNGSLPPLAASTNQLVLPNRFTGPIQGTMLYFSQGDYRGSTGWTHVQSRFNIDDSVVTSY